MLGITGRLLQVCWLGLGLGLGLTLGLGLGLANPGPNPNATLSPSPSPKQDCVHEIERMQVSDGGGGEVRLLPHLPVVGHGPESATRLLLPRKLLGETAAGVAALDPAQCAWAEAHPASVLTGVLTVLGRPLAALEGWANVQRQMGDDLLQEVATFDASARGRARMWAESIVATQGLTSAEVLPLSLTRPLKAAP